MELPLLLILLLGVAGRGGALSVNEALNASQKISPQCRNALHSIKPTSLQWKEAAFASADFSASLGILLNKQMAAGNQGKYAIVHGFSVSDVGSYDSCMTLVSHGYHYCDMRVKDRSVIRWDFCLPQGCTPDDVRAAMLPPNLGKELSYVCDQGAKVHHMAVAAFGAVFVVLLALAALATATDLRRRRRSEGEGLGEQLLMSFSVVRGLQELLGPRTGALKSFDGMRALSIIFVILGHTYALQGRAVGYTNPDYAYSDWNATFGGMLAGGSFFAVTTFFYLGGFLAVSLGARHLDKMIKKRGSSGGARAWLSCVPSMYLHRWLRIVPAYAFIVAGAILLSPLVMEGPVTTLFNKDVQHCKQHWWWNLLFIGNFFTHSMWDICYPVSWYLNVDMQLWMTTPFFILLGLVNEKAAYAVAAALYAASVSYSGWAAQAHHMSVNLFHPHHKIYELYYYIQPWTRFPAYYTGCVAGLIWVHHGDQMRRAVARLSSSKSMRARVALLACVSAVLLALPIFGTKGVSTMKGEAWPLWKVSLYVSLSEPAFAMGVALMAGLLLLQLGGPINVLLECRFLLVLSRLTFGAYLIHPALLFIWSNERVLPQHFGNMDLWVGTFGISSMTFLLSAAVFLLVEKPFGDLSRLLLSGAGGKRSEEKDKLPQSSSMDLTKATSVSSQMSLQTPTKRCDEAEYDDRSLEEGEEEQRAVVTFVGGRAADEELKSSSEDGAQVIELQSRA